MPLPHIPQLTVRPRNTLLHQVSLMISEQIQSPHVGSGMLNFINLRPHNRGIILLESDDELMKTS